MKDTTFLTVAILGSLAVGVSLMLDQGRGYDRGAREAMAFTVEE